MWSRRKDLWVRVSMVTLLAHYAGGSWLTMFLLTVGVYALGRLLPSNTEALLQKRWYSALLLLTFYLLISGVLPMSVGYWPGEKGELVVPGILLALAVFGCGKRPERVAGVLLWAIALLSVPVLMASVKDVKPGWLLPGRMECTLWTIPAILLPIGVGLTLEGRNDQNILRGGIAAAGIWAMVSGILSDAVAANTDLPIRHMARNLEMGPYSRLESVVSVAMTLGLYSCVNLLLVCANHCWNTFQIKENRKGLLHGMILYPLLIKGTKVPVEITAGCTVIAWIILPFISAKINSKK